MDSPDRLHSTRQAESRNFLSYSIRRRDSRIVFAPVSRRCSRCCLLHSQRMRQTYAPLLILFLPGIPPSAVGFAYYHRSRGVNRFCKRIPASLLLPRRGQIGISKRLTENRLKCCHGCYERSPGHAKTGRSLAYCLKVGKPSHGHEKPQPHTHP